MPESAEVKITTEFLHTMLENKVITNWDIIGGRYDDVSPPGFEELENNLPLLVESVKCKGKLIYFTLFNESGNFYIIHNLRMTGRWQEKKDKQACWIVDIDNSNALWFRDLRGLATLEITRDESVLKREIDKLGPDILTPYFSLTVWKELLETHKNKNITAFLMSQDIISGIGNYLKAETLHYAKISPLRKVGSLKDHESDKLFEAIRIIPRISYNKGGLGLKTYAGTKGEFDKELKIYGKKNAEKTKTADGRITHWDTDKQH